ncbi:right-handed parallel beta-helix repeat-containing protein, partial [Novosphingobium sp. 1949]
MTQTVPPFAPPRRRAARIAVALTALTASLATSLVLSGTALAQSREVKAGDSWTVARTTRLDSLHIAPGGVITAPKGKIVTLSVDGRTAAIAPGDYQGSIVLAVAEPVAWTAFLGDKHYAVPAGLYVNDGKVDAARSLLTPAAGTIDAQKASNLSITSALPGFTGVIVEGDTHYTLDHPVITLSGNGVDDSIGYGAGIAVKGKAVVTINNPVIRAHGVVRTAIFVDGAAQVEVNGADIETWDGTLPADYTFSIEPGKMMEVPYGLGISGNVRATNVQGTSHVTYRNSRIRAEAWGALATDGAGPTALTVIDSTIETVRSGYGAYANGEAQDLFDNTVFRVTDYGLIVGGPGSATFTNGSFVSSGKYGVMMHQGTGGGVVRFEKGAAMVSARTAFLVKDRGTTIELDHARVVPGNGVLVQTMANDDPIMAAMMAAGPPPGGAPGAAPGGGAPG